MALSHLASQTPEKLVEYFEKALEAWRDPYHPDDNPQGYINLSVAENKLSAPLIAEKLSKIPPIPYSNISYTEPHGSKEVRQVVANFLQRFISRTPVSADQVVLLNGACSIINNLSSLICDPGQHVIICGPGYRGLQGQLSTYAGTGITVANLDKDVHGELIFPPLHTVDSLQDAFDRAQTNGHVVRAVLVCSPHNPTGEILSEALILDIVTWARAHELHIIFDELYSLSIHDDRASHKSVAQILGGQLGDDVHVVWSMSKDLCSSGIRLGVLFSQNKQLIRACASTLATFHMSSRLVQWTALHMLADFDWLNTFIEENKRQLRQAYQKSVQALNELKVPFVPASAGFFILADFRRFMSGETKEAERDLWMRICETKVLITPSAEFYASHYGFFRICFAAVEPHVLEVAWTKLRNLLL